MDTEIKNIESQLWEVFELLKSQSLLSSDYFVILYLLSIHKDGVVLDNVLVDDFNTHRNLYDRIRNLNVELKEDYIELYSSFEPAINNIQPKALHWLLHLISKIDRVPLNKHFVELFDSILYQIIQMQGKNGNQMILPEEIARFMCNLADLPKESKIYNPFAGMASFGVNMKEEQIYIGQEINRISSAVGLLRIMAYGKRKNSVMKQNDSMLDWPHKSIKFDLVIANPPLGMRLNPSQRESIIGIRTIEQFLIQNGLNSLDSNGKLITIVPLSFLSNSTLNGVEFRRKLIENNLIETIISFPGGLLTNTGLAIAVIVINKNKQSPNKVQFVDAKDFINSTNSRKIILKDYELLKVIKKEDGNSVRVIDNSFVREHDYNLNPRRYFLKPIKGKKLGDLLIQYRGEREEELKHGKVVRIRDLKEDTLNYSLVASEIDEKEFPKISVRAIKESCLLIATRWKSIKPTWFEYKGTPIYLTPDIHSYSIKEDVVTKAFLINELHADYVQEQLEAYRIGDTVQMLKRIDLQEIVIKVPSLKEQRAKMKGIFEISDKIEALKNERNALAHGKEVSQFNEIASLKHTLGRPRQNLQSWSDNLIYFAENNLNEVEPLNKKFEKLYNTGIIAVLKEMKNDVDFMTEVLEKGENGFVIEQYEKTLIPLSQLNRIVKGYTGGNFKFKVNKHLLTEDKLKERGINGNIVLLRTLIDNLLTNSNKYGFKEKLPGNEVVFELKVIDNILEIEIKNNGNPFPKNMDKGKFTTKYSTSSNSKGSGLGGYDIDRIAKYLGNTDWELILNEDPIYPVIFKFQFKIELIK